MFNADNFAHCPMGLITTALQQIEEDRLVELSQLTTPVALVGTALLKSKGVKEAKPEWFNPYPKELARRAAKQLISKRAANTFVSLEKQRRLTPWLYKYKDVIEKIRLVSDDAI